MQHAGDHDTDDRRGDEDHHERLGQRVGRHQQRAGAQDAATPAAIRQSSPTTKSYQNLPKALT